MPDCIPKIDTQCMLPKPKPSLSIIYSWCCLLNSPQNQPLSFCEEARRYQFQLMPTTHSFKKPDWLCTEHTNLHSHHQICAGFQTDRKQSPFSTSQSVRLSPCLDGLSCFGFPRGKPFQLPVVNHSSPHVCARTHPPGLRTPINTWPQPRVQLQT